jgi:hypothetical protein
MTLGIGHKGRTAHRHPEGHRVELQLLSVSGLQPP